MRQRHRSRLAEYRLIGIRTNIPLHQALLDNPAFQDGDFDTQFIADFDFAMEAVSGIRTIRKENQIAFKDTIELIVADKEEKGASLDPVIKKLGNVSEITHSGDKVAGALTFRVKANEYFVPISGAVNVEDQIAKLSEELNYTEGFLKSVQKKLSNERFVNNAPEQVVANEKKKLADTEAKIRVLKEKMEGLG